MHIVVTVREDPFRGLTVDAFGPWDQAKCDRERRRLLADFAHREPWASAMHQFCAQVVSVRDEVVAP